MVCKILIQSAINFHHLFQFKRNEAALSPIAVAIEVASVTGFRFRRKPPELKIQAAGSLSRCRSAVFSATQAIKLAHSTNASRKHQAGFQAKCILPWHLQFVGRSERKLCIHPSNSVTSGGLQGPLLFFSTDPRDGG
ncbi:hypothetical protein NPIL_146291 [Nephila pilipes]|uniref:Uncharacterized protein n=1 Tax=Nephila pilipes TaxID=299642 RepID=A0A8X6Q475_NEPPI|nr:hypothetical protein NPIL_146291 [Nephila pilipes]